MNLAFRYNPVYSVADYQRWEGQWELIDGVAIAMTPSPSGEHQQAGMRLANAIYSQLQQQDCHDCFVYYELDWVVDQNTVVRPDLMIVCGKPVAQYLETAPTLIVEILSPSTQEKDRSVKWNLYQQQQVPYYVITDPATQKLEVFEWVDGSYRSLPANEGRWRLKLHTGCEIEVKSEE